MWLEIKSNFSKRHPKGYAFPKSSPKLMPESLIEGTTLEERMKMKSIIFFCDHHRTLGAQIGSSHATTASTRMEVKSA